MLQTGALKKLRSLAESGFLVRYFVTLCLFKCYPVRDVVPNRRREIFVHKRQVSRG